MLRPSHQENDFLEYLQLDGGNEPRLVTKSELLAEVRDRGGAISDRQLTFYVSEGLIPKSVRVGSRAGAYPKVVVDLLVWVLRSREQGLSVDAIKELLPVWKFVMTARRERRLDLAELEYVARQRIESFEAVTFVPNVVMDVMSGLCSECLREVVIVTKDGMEHSLGAPDTTIGFTAFRAPGPDEDGDPVWWGYRRIVIPIAIDPGEDPSCVVLGLPPGAGLPPMPSAEPHAASHTIERESGGDGLGRADRAMSHGRGAVAQDNPQRQ